MYNDGPGGNLNCCWIGNRSADYFAAVAYKTDRLTIGRLAPDIKLCGCRLALIATAATGCSRHFTVDFSFLNPDVEHWPDDLFIYIKMIDDVSQ